MFNIFCLGGFAESGSWQGEEAGMGNSTSKEEQLYQAVQNGNHNTVKALRRDGASLEVRIVGRVWHVFCQVSEIVRYERCHKIAISWF